MQAAPLSPYFIDRASHLREDRAWIHAQLNNPTTRLIAIHNTSVLCHDDNATSPCFLSAESVRTDPQTSIFLGQVDGITYFTLPIQTDESAQGLCQTNQATFQEYTTKAPMLESEHRDLVSLACFTNHWHSRHQHCGTCGSATVMQSAGHMRSCTGTTCTQQYFPSMDPAVIVLIEHGDRCLLGRQKHWPEGMHSTLAGFVEPGETIEATVAREVNEEAGIQIEAIHYHSSQSWLFPNSLMLGFTAKATTTEINIDPHELESAKWFTREEVKANPQMLPNQESISYALIQDWLNR